jgi:hypothetical protein
LVSFYERETALLLRKGAAQIPAAEAALKAFSQRRARSVSSSYARDALPDAAWFDTVRHETWFHHYRSIAFGQLRAQIGALKEGRAVVPPAVLVPPRSRAARFLESAGEAAEKYAEPALDLDALEAADRLTAPGAFGAWLERHDWRPYKNDGIQSVLFFYASQAALLRRFGPLGIPAVEEAIRDFSKGRVSVEAPAPGWSTAGIPSEAIARSWQTLWFHWTWQRISRDLRERIARLSGPLPIANENLPPLLTFQPPRSWAPPLPTGRTGSGDPRLAQAA